MLRSLRVVAIIAALCTVPVAASADIIAEYHLTTYDGLEMFYANYVVGQTFKATITATVSDVLAPIHAYGTNPSGIPLTFSIFNAVESSFNGLQPTGSPLSTGTIAWTNPQISTLPPEWVGASMSPATLQAGTTYMLVATAQGTNSAYGWYCGVSNYAYGYLTEGFSTGGDLGPQYPYDLPFQIAGTVPEPTTLAIFAVSTLGLLRRRRA